MKIVKSATAGTLESSDVFVQIVPSEEGIEIELQSVVLNQFGDQIRETVEAVLAEHEVEQVKITLNDRGAAEYAIRARVETALLRAKEETV